MDEIIKKIAKISLFKGLSEREINYLIVDNIHYRIKHFHNDETILMQGRPYESLYFLLSGKCFGEMTNINGKIIKVEEFNAPDIIAPAIPFAETPVMPVSLIAKSKVVIVVFQPSEFFRLLQSHAKVLENFLKETSQKIILLSRRLEFMSFHTIKTKLAQFILKNAQDGIAHLPYGYEELAQYVGVARPSVYRVFNELEEEGLIKKNGRTITIIDFKALSQLLE